MMKKYKRLERRKQRRLASGSRTVKNAAEQQYLTTLLSTASRNERRLEKLRAQYGDSSSGKGVVDSSGQNISRASTMDGDTLSPWYIGANGMVNTYTEGSYSFGHRRPLTLAQLEELYVAILMGQAAFDSTIRKLTETATTHSIDKYIDAEHIGRFDAMCYCNRNLGGVLYDGDM